MINKKRLGIEIRKYRKELEISAKEMAKQLRITRSYFSRIENGHDLPSKTLLNKIISKLGLGLEEANRLLFLSGFRKGEITSEKNLPPHVKETESKAFVNSNVSSKPITNPHSPESNSHEKIGKIAKNEIQVEMKKDMIALYSDSAFITTNKFGAMIDFAQNIASTNQQVIISRVGLSLEHAKILAETILKQLQKTQDEE